MRLIAWVKANRYHIYLLNCVHMYGIGRFVINIILMVSYSMQCWSKNTEFYWSYAVLLYTDNGVVCRLTVWKTYGHLHIVAKMRLFWVWMLSNMNKFRDFQLTLRTVDVEFLSWIDESNDLRRWLLFTDSCIAIRAVWAAAFMAAWHEKLQGRIHK